MIGSTFIWSLIHLMTKLFWLPYLYPKSEHCDNSFENHRQNQLPNCFKYSSTCFSSRPVWNIDIQCGVSGFIVAAKIEKSLLLEYESQTERFEETIDHCSYTHHSIDLKKVQKEIQACMGFEPMTSAIQPRSQGLSSHRPQRARRDPGTRWSRVSQNLGDDN